MWLFGSILRDDFRDDSDVDVLVETTPQPNDSLYEWVDMIDELKKIFGREVHLVDAKGLKNPYRRATIFGSHA
jgi:hypothetical protein